MDWNNDGLNDLLVGDAAGFVHIFLNTTDNINPEMDGGTLIQRGGVDLDIGARAAPVVIDWNEDGLKDILVGSFDGWIFILINEGTDAAPVFNSSSVLQMGGTDFDAGTRAAPRIFDWDGDGLKDVLTGEVEGFVYFLQNVGTNAAPVFDTAEKLLLIDDDPLRYPDDAETPRSRLFVTNWDNEGPMDIVLGGKDGRLMLFLADYDEEDDEFG